MVATVYPEDKEEAPLPPEVEKPKKKPSKSSKVAPDPVAEFVKKLNLEEEYNL